VPIAVTAEQLAIADSVGQWAKRAGTIRAVRDLEECAGHAGAADETAAARWAALAELGIFSIAVPRTLGGAGGTAADVAVVAEQLAAVLAPGPMMPTLLAGLVLARTERAGEDGAAARALLAEIADGRARVGAVLTAAAEVEGRESGGLAGTIIADGRLRVSGTASLVLGATDATHLLLCAVVRSGGARAAAGWPAGDGPVWFLLQTSRPGVTLMPRAPVDFSRPLADVRLDAVTVESGLVLRTDPRLVHDLAAVLAAAEAAGLAAWCCRTAAEYATSREQFGRPIGSFQAVKHLCAQMLCRAELASAAAWDAARGACRAPGELTVAAAAAAGLVLDAATDNAKDCIQVLGGIGFTWEHDAHLYLRRAVALRSLLGGGAAWRARTAGLALSGARRHPAEAEEALDLSVPAGADKVRAAARVVANAVSATPREDWRDGLAEVGYAAPSWPPPYGLAAGPATVMIIDEELARAGIERPDLGIGAWAIPAISSHGSPAQLERFAWATLTGAITWCQLFSEPEAGSDLASLRTRAVRADGGWRLTGRKVWTSLASEADWAICLARIDQAEPQHHRSKHHQSKHGGITFFLVRMDDPGVDVRPLREITGRAMFNEVFLDDVFVPDDCVVGDPGDGWRVARTTLATERVAMARGAGLGEDATQLLTAVTAAGSALDPVATDQIGARLAEALALSAMDDRLAAVIAKGGDTGSMSAVRKLLGVAHRQAVAETALALAGVDGAAADGPAAAAVDSFLLTRCLSIAGGTSQILLSLVAERVLGLPRDEARR
jgi:3-oxochol-4-en-24-oyl-CoA dehydrogenase